MKLLVELLQTLLGTALNVLPIAAIVVFFQLAVIRRPMADPRRLVIGFGYVLLGLSCFLLGLQKALFPLGQSMARQLADPVFIYGAAAGALHWTDYYWIYLFAVTLGFSTAIAEPALLAVALKVHQVSGGAIGVWGLRIAVALGVAVGIGLGTLRIVIGAPVYGFVLAGCSLIIVQTCFAPRAIIPLAYDSGSVATSTVTVPLVVALGLGLAQTVPGRSPLLDGFGMIILACLFPMITVMGYAQLAEYRSLRAARHRRESPAAASD